MSADSSAFKEELDRLKSKYRKEALRAVATASTDAYEKGKADAREQLEREVGQWKAIAEAVTSSDVDRSKPVLLVQHVMEQVYRDIKLDFSDTKELSMAKIKAILQSSTHKLMAEMPAVVLASAKRRSEEGDIAVAPSGQAQQHTGTLPAPPLVRAVLPVSNPAASQRTRYLLHACDAPPKHFVSVYIADVSGNVVKGIFVDGQFVSYNVTVLIESLVGGSRPPRCQRVEKRASDVKALRQLLCKEFPRATIPSVPNRNYKIVALARNPKRPKKPEQKVQYRRRLYALWLQYVSNMEGVQASPTLAQFLVGDDHLDGVAPPHESADAPQSLRSFGSAAIFAAVFEDAQRGRRGIRASEAAERAEAAAFLADNLTGDFPGDAASRAAWGRSHLLSNPYLSSQDAGSAGEGSHRHLFALESAALRDLRTVERDATQLHSVGVSAVAACRALVESCCGFNSEMGDFLGELSAWQQLEPPDSLEFAALDAVSARAAESVAAAECVGEGLQCALLEPAEFLYDHCVQSAKEGLDAVLRAFPPASFLSEQPYYSSPVHAGEPSGHSRSGATGLSLLQRTQEGVAAAAAVARSWDNGRQVRGTMFLHTVLRAASTLAQEHGRARVVWESARASLAQMNIAMDGGGEEGTAFDRAASQASNGDHIVPAMQSASSSLKLAIQSELGSFARPHEAERSSLMARPSECAASGGDTTTWRKASVAPVPTPVHQDFGESGSNRVVKAPGSHKGLTALKSFKAIFSRAIMPAGKRRSPSVCRPAPSLLPSEEDAIAALYNAQHAEADTSSNGSRKQGEVRPQAGEADSLLQQDQRQARLAARRQATAQTGGGHVTSKIKTSSNVQAVAQAPDADAFSAAPRPAAAVVSHAVYTTPTDLPTAAPAHAMSTHSAPSAATSVAAPPSADGGSTKLNPKSRRTEGVEDGTSDTRGAQTPSPLAQPATPTVARSGKAPVSAASTRTSEEAPPAAAAPMPSGWVEVEAEGGGVYYYHSVTRVSRWDRPNEEVAAALEARIQQANAQVDDALQKHKEERLREQERQNEREAQIEHLRAKVKDRVDKWAYGRALGLVAPKVVSGASAAAPATRDLALLLCSLHTLIPYIPDADAVLNAANIPQPPSVATCPPSEIKKAYMRAVRFVHPDKLPDDASVETQLVAEAVFIILTDAYNKHRAGASGSV